ncbi:Mif2/CENP-C like-domain-containing protein [Mycena floridula]|nr:Mif2/CENP-C like-domain-containing protein [Mycena floridula]
MPTSARKSSLGAAGRRVQQKAHIPYRGDNPEVGKKTGVAVNHVAPTSDGFENFEELIGTVDQNQPQKRKKKQSLQLLEEDEYDEDGEQSMDVDSPIQYLANSRKPTTPSRLSRVGSSSRPVARTSDVDFDRVPSPRPQRTPANGRAPSHSSLSKSYRNHQLSPERESDPQNPDDFDGGIDDFAQDDSPKQTSFMDMDRDDDEDDDELPVPPSPPSAKKGKGKRPIEQLGDEELDIVNGLNDIDDQQTSDDEQATPVQKPRGKKAKSDAEKPAPTKKPVVKRSKKENVVIVTPDGVRRSSRARFKPLDHWRNERFVYGHPDSDGLALVPHIKEIIRIPRDPVEPLGKKGKRSKRSRSATVVQQVNAVNPEEGWDDDVNPTCSVMDYETHEEADRRIAYIAKHVQPTPAHNSEWLFHKMFTDSEFIAAGQLHIPPHGQKPSKATKDNTYVFYVIEGAVNLKIGDTSMVLCTGAMFMVPRGNTYFIRNISDRTTKLFFTQARKVQAQGSVSPSPRKKRTPGRSSSAMDMDRSETPRPGSSKV